MEEPRQAIDTVVERLREMTETAALSGDNAELMMTKFKRFIFYRD